MRRMSGSVALCLLCVACSRGPATSGGKESGGSSQRESAEKAEKKDEPAKDEAGKDEKGEQKSSLITMQIDAQTRAGVQASAVQTASLPDYLELTGTVQPVESRIGHVRSLARGRLEQILVKVGEHVNAGQPVVRFDNIEAGELSTQLFAAQSELARLQIQEAAATRQTERNRRLVQIGASAQKDLDASQADQDGLAQAVRAQQSNVAGLQSRLTRFGVRDPASSKSSITMLRAPFAGVVLNVEAAPGAVIDSSTEVLGIADLSRVYVEAQVYEKDLGVVRIGQTASIISESYRGVHFTGRVVSIGDRLDPQKRTAPVRCEVANGGAKLKLDMFASVALPTAARRTGVALPPDAIQNLDGKQVVFVRHSATQFEVRPVNVGHASQEKIEVTSGLKEGEEVVTKGAFQVKSALLSKELGEKE